MKHIKLFESFSGSPAQLLVSGDWSGITNDGRPDDWIAPATFFFQYLPPGSPIPTGYEYVTRDRDFYTDLELISEESFGGDQNGVNVAPKQWRDLTGKTSQQAEDLRNGVLRLFIDPSINVEELESHLREEAEEIWSAGSDEEYYDVLDRPEDFDPSYLKMAKMNRPFPRKIVFEK
jgi:hypothetical protein